MPGTRCVIPLVLACGLATAAAADESPWWQVWRSAEEPARAAVRDSGLFSEREQALIRSFFDRHAEDYRDDHEAPPPAKGPGKHKALPPGLQKKLARGGELPPGWQKKVARGEVLDPGVYERAEYLPPDLRHRLPAGPPGTEVRRVQDKVVRILSATREIIDVLDL